MVLTRPAISAGGGVRGRYFFDSRSKPAFALDDFDWGFLENKELTHQGCRRSIRVPMYMYILYTSQHPPTGGVRNPNRLQNGTPTPIHLAPCRSHLNVLLI